MNRPSERAGAEHDPQEFDAREPSPPENAESPAAADGPLSPETVECTPVDAISPPESPSAEGGPMPLRRDWSRRCFGQAVLASTPVLLTLYGRPLWAGTNCTVSGWVSGNTSLHHELKECAGDTPGYWQGPASKDQNSGWRATHTARLDSINGFPALVLTVDGLPCTLQQAVERQTPIDGVRNTTRQTIRFGIAALLNARYRTGYGLTEWQVVNMVTAAVLEGYYQAPGGEWLTEEQVTRFLENTMNVPAWGP